MKPLFLIILSLLFFTASEQNKSVKASTAIFTTTEKEAFKKDKFGCEGQRIGLNNHFSKNENIIKSMTVEEVLETFGEPDQEINGCWLYFLHSEHHCRTKVEAEVVADSFLKLCFEKGHVVKVSLDETLR